MLLLSASRDARRFAASARAREEEALSLLATFKATDTHTHKHTETLYHTPCALIALFPLFFVDGEKKKNL